jgi:murein DD-endopeptidase MepM/ murein hydrolase activator NlpD
VLGLLLVAVLYGISPQKLDTRTLDAFLGRGMHDFAENTYAAATYEYVESYARMTSDERYLEPGSIPFTAESWSEALPQIAEPRRMVRTTVTVYTVQAGDTMLGIAQKFGLQGTSVLYANSALSSQSDTLSIGQQLNILPVDGAYYKVASGDSLEGIATKFKADADAIALYPGNNLNGSYALVAGQSLIIPGGIRPAPPKPVQTAAASRSTTTARAVAAAPAPSVAASGDTAGSGSFGWPMSGGISQGYWAGHRAIDIYAPRGTAVYAADGGTVVAAYYSNVGYGRHVIVDHGNGFQTLYAHMDAFYVEAGQAVAKGQQLGQCGSTGNSTGPHLHFEVRSGGAQYNPMSYLP